VFNEERVELVGQRCEPLRKLRTRLRRQLAVRDVTKAVAVGFDQAPAGGAEAGIEAEDFQANLSSSSSGTS
jgi:hypothetical protein